MKTILAYLRPGGSSPARRPLGEKVRTLQVCRDEAVEAVLVRFQHVQAMRGAQRQALLTSRSRRPSRPRVNSRRAARSAAEEISLRTAMAPVSRSSDSARSCRPRQVATNIVGARQFRQRWRGRCRGWRPSRWQHGVLVAWALQSQNAIIVFHLPFSNRSFVFAFFRVNKWFCCYFRSCHMKPIHSKT